MIARELFNDGQHKWVVMARDPDKQDQVIDTNEYLIVSNGDALLLDPGGTEIFPSVLRTVAKVVEIEQIKTFLASHQDPDVMSSLPLWMGLCSEAEVHMPWLWTGFITHFGVEYANRFVAIPDHGGPLPVGKRGRSLTLVPAHYCHSSGNFSVYDPHARILFSGDCGAALLPKGYDSLYVKDFESHIPLMEGFHKRWMPSNEAKNRWIQRVRKLDVEQLCPQHGAIFRGEQVRQFLDWFEALQVGQDNTEEALLATP